MSGRMTGLDSAAEYDEATVLQRPSAGVVMGAGRGGQSPGAQECRGPRVPGQKIVGETFNRFAQILHVPAYKSAQFGIESVENLIADRRNRFISRHGETETIICVKCYADWLICVTVFLFIAFV